MSAPKPIPSNSSSNGQEKKLPSIRPSGHQATTQKHHLLLHLLIWHRIISPQPPYRFIGTYPSAAPRRSRVFDLKAATATPPSLPFSSVSQVASKPKRRKAVHSGRAVFCWASRHCLCPRPLAAVSTCPCLAECMIASHRFVSPSLVRLSSI